MCAACGPANLPPACSCWASFAACPKDEAGQRPNSPLPSPNKGPEREDSSGASWHDGASRRATQEKRAGRAGPTSSSPEILGERDKPHESIATYAPGDRATSVRVVVDQRRVQKRHGPLVADVVRRDGLALQRPPVNQLAAVRRELDVVAQTRRVDNSHHIT